MDCSPPGSSVHGDSPGKNTGVGCHFLLQGIFPNQGWNSCLLHRQTDSLPLSLRGSPLVQLGDTQHIRKAWLQNLLSPQGRRLQLSPPSPSNHEATFCLRGLACVATLPIHGIKSAFAFSCPLSLLVLVITRLRFLSPFQFYNHVHWRGLHHLSDSGHTLGRGLGNQEAAPTGTLARACLWSSPCFYACQGVRESESLSRVQLFVTPWTTHKQPMGSSRPQYWSG